MENENNFVTTHWNHVSMSIKEYINISAPVCLN